MPKNYGIDELVPCGSESSSVLVMLYGYDENFLYAKGSWGLDIAEKGFFKIRMGGGGSGICGVLSRNFIPVLSL